MSGNQERKLTNTGVKLSVQHHPHLLQDEVQVDALLPVDVRVTEAGQLLRVPPVDLHLHLKHSPQFLMFNVLHCC